MSIGNRFIGCNGVGLINAGSISQSMGKGTRYWSDIQAEKPERVLFGCCLGVVWVLIDAVL